VQQQRLVINGFCSFNCNVGQAACATSHVDDLRFRCTD
jgi:hypothetical protein